jgi:exopolysaccharide biosynthesis polyprenyl glycosylphosphotransferase
MNGVRGNSRSSAWIFAGVVLGTACGLVTSWARGMWSMTMEQAAVAFLGMGASTEAARHWLAARSRPRPARRRRVLLVGNGPVADHLARQAEERGYHVLGTVEDLDPEFRLDWPEQVLAPRAALPELALYLKADQILVADAPSRVWALVEEIEREDVPAEIYVVPDAYELALCRPTSFRVGDVPLLRLPRRRVSPVYRVAKRVMDVGASFLMLLLFGPLLVLAMLAVRLGSPGSSLFRQERIGKNGRSFQIVKFRTMVADAEKDGPQFCRGKEDPRLTKVGRFLRRTHLDELPQLWNVLRGEMSLVGPRPERPCFVEQFERELPRYAERHRVLPGITGLAQVNGFYHSSAREKLRYDLMYVYHPSLALDLSIILRTVLCFFH